ncbi:MAG: IclR family transcriptional regulator [Verrucomicrobiaceae bacterium]|nr:IclR family transcriptional regulator [Verrucomicrobiaceae bacterium]
MLTPKVPALLPEDSAASSGTDRTLAILEVLSSHGHAGMTIAEIGRTLELPQNSVFRIMDTLHERGYVERDDSRRYALTGKLLDLAKPKVGDKSLAACAFDALCELRDATGETAQLAVCSQHRCVLIEQVASRQPIKVLGEVGLRIPLYSCAPGKAMLAALPQRELEEFFQTITLKKFTSTTLSSKKALLADLAAIRERGYSLDRAEGMEGIHCVGAVVLDGNDFPVAAVTVIGPSFRLTESTFIGIGKRCISAAIAIRQRLLA